MTNVSNFHLKEVPGHSRAIVDLAWNNDGSYLCSTFSDKTSKIYQLDGSSSTLREIMSFRSTWVARHCCWHPIERNRFCISGDGDSIEIWDVRGSTPSFRMPSSENNIMMSWSKDGKYIAIGNRNDYVSIYDAIAGRLIKKFKYPLQINDIWWSARSDYIFIATGSTAAISSVDVVHFQIDSLSEFHWEISTKLESHTGHCVRVLSDPNYQKLFVAGGDFQVSLWTLADLLSYKSIPFESEIGGVSFSGNGETIAIAHEKGPSKDARITFFDSDQGTACGEFTNISSPVSVLKWHPSLPLIAFARSSSSSSATSSRNNSASDFTRNIGLLSFTDRKR